MQFLIGLGSWGLFCWFFSRLERTWKWFKWLLLLQTGKIRTVTTEQRRCPGLWGADSPSAKANSWWQGMLLLQVGTSQHLKAEDFYGKTISVEMNREWLSTVSTKSRRSNNKINGSQVAFLHTMCRILWELEVYLASKKCLNKFIGKKKKSPYLALNCKSRETDAVHERNTMAGICFWQLTEKGETDLSSEVVSLFLCLFIHLWPQNLTASFPDTGETCSYALPAGLTVTLLQTCSNHWDADRNLLDQQLQRWHGGEPSSC